MRLGCFYNNKASNSTRKQIVCGIVSFQYVAIYFPSDSCEFVFKKQ